MICASLCLQVFAEEGWHALLGQTVPQLAACYKALSHPAYPHWLMKLLSLPAVGWTSLLSAISNPAPWPLQA